MNNRVVYELKPYNTNSINQGRKQLAAYINYLEESTGEIWHGILDLY